MFLKMQVFWEVIPCRLASSYRHSEGLHCLPSRGLAQKKKKISVEVIDPIGVTCGVTRRAGTPNTFST
jgi:hypothetical protein